MSSPIRVGLAGLGMMGRNHVRVLRALPDVELVAVTDTAGDPHNLCPPGVLAQTLEGLIESKLDLCVVATPTHTHESIGLRLAEAGIPALIEKPLAHDQRSAEKLVNAFEANGVIGCVGQIERYNPALQSLRSRLSTGDLGEVFQVVTRRQGPFPARVSDVGVVFDLATHDIDLTSWVTGSEYQTVSAWTAHRSGRTNEDLVAVAGRLENGTVVSHLVNWLSPLKERVTAVTGERGCLVADTLTADLTFYENGTQKAEWDRVAEFRGVSEGNVTRFAISKPEPLLTELSAMVAAVKGEAFNVVTLRQGLATVKVAECVRRAAFSGEVVKVEL